LPSSSAGVTAWALLTAARKYQGRAPRFQLFERGL